MYTYALSLLRTFLPSSPLPPTPALPRLVPRHMGSPECAGVAVSPLGVDQLPSTPRGRKCTLANTTLKGHIVDTGMIEDRWRWEVREGEGDGEREGEKKNASLRERKLEGGGGWVRGLVSG